MGSHQHSGFTAQTTVQVSLCICDFQLVDVKEMCGKVSRSCPASGIQLWLQRLSLQTLLDSPPVPTSHHHPVIIDSSPFLPKQKQPLEGCVEAAIRCSNSSLAPRLWVERYTPSDLACKQDSAKWMHRLLCCSSLLRTIAWHASISIKQQFAIRPDLNVCPTATQVVQASGRS